MEFWLSLAYVFLMLRASYGFCVNAFDRKDGWTATGFALEILAIIYLICKAV